VAETRDTVEVLTWNINLFTGTASTLDRLVRLRPRPDVVTRQEVSIGHAEAIKLSDHSPLSAVLTYAPDRRRARQGPPRL